MADLESAKKRLSEVLKDNIQKYWDLMKSWYRRKITKEGFDSKAKTLLGESNVHLHNEFLFAILVKCQTGNHPDAPQPVTAAPYPPPVTAPVSKTSPPPPPVAVGGRPKLKKQRRFSPPPPAEIPYGALDAIQYHVPPTVQITGRDLDSIMLCAHDLMLPDFPTLHTRMLLLAWETGLDGISDESAKLLLFSLQNYLKNVIQTLITHQCSWRSRKRGQFQYSFGSGLASVALTSQLTDTVPSSNAFSLLESDEPSSSSGETGDATNSEPSSVREISSSLQPMSISEAESVMVASRGATTKRLESLTLFHLRDALMMNRHCIPVHSVYACNMERISAMMWHPSREEQEQQRTVQQWRKSLVTKPPFTITTAAIPLR